MRAGLKTIPYFIDEEFDSYDQVNENELHDRLTPWAKAQFIVKRIKKGESKGEIAHRLREKSQSVVTEYLALLDPPGCVVSAYAAGVKSPRTLYDLRKARDEFPEEFDVWCASSDQITRDTIKALLNTLRSLQPAQDHTQPALEKAELHLTSVGPPELSSNERPQAAPIHDSEDAGVSAAETARTNSEVEKRAAGAATRRTTMVSAQEFRHDEKAPVAVSKDTAASLPVKAKDGTQGIAVQYKGHAAILASDTIVRIVVDGHDLPFEVKVSELVFKRR